MIDSLSGLVVSLEKNGDVMQKSFAKDDIHITYGFKPYQDEYFCPKCGATRRGQIKLLSGLGTLRVENSAKYFFNELPWLLKVNCLQCQESALLLIYSGANGQELAVFHSTYGGCVTPNTPQSVKYYIDQAYRARSLGAVSASMAMIRAALESILYEQGYKNGMLDSKIKQLEATIHSKVAPEWALSIDTQYLHAIKKIGNGAIHCNDGDISKQEVIDKEFLEIVDIIFAELLDTIYERPIRSARNLVALQAKASVFDK